MEEEKKWRLFSALWILLGIWGIVVEDMPLGVGCIFLGLFYQMDRLIFGPQKFAGIKKRDKVIVAIMQLGSVVVGIVVGHLTLGPWGAVAGFISISIIAEAIIFYLWFKGLSIFK